jgi:hypothetical protein
MKDINIKEIIDLATQDVTDPEAELQKVYDWYNERKIMIIKGTVSVSISLLITLAISYYKDEIKIHTWLIIIPIIFSILSMTYGFYELLLLRRIGKNYVAAITLLNKLKKIKPFLILYRRILGI